MCTPPRLNVQDHQPLRLETYIARQLEIVQYCKAGKVSQSAIKAW